MNECESCGAAAVYDCHGWFCDPCRAADAIAEMAAVKI